MAFVVSSGEVRSLSAPGLAPVSSLRLTDDYSASYAALWRAQGSVRTVVDFLGRNIASLGLHLFKRVGEADRKRVRDHPVASLLGAPNPATTPYRLMDALVRDLAIYDRAYWLKLKNKDGEPRSLVRLPPYRVRAVGGNWMWPEAFEFSGAKKTKVFPADQIVHFRGYSPDDGLDGSSSIEALRRVLAEEFEAGRMREQTLRNGARASGYLERPKEAAKWSPEARDRFSKSWRSQYSGDGPQAGGTPILEDGMKFVSASQTAKDLQYVEARKLTREEVASAYFIPPTMVGLMEGATFSNVKEQHKHLYQDTLGPWLQMIVQEIALQLLPDFSDTAGLYLEFNLEEKLRGSFEDQAAQLQSSVGGPWMTRNEARAMRNLPAIEGGDELIVPLNVIEGGQASPQDSAPLPLEAAGPRLALKGAGPAVKGSPAMPDSHVEAGEKVLKEYFEAQRESVIPALTVAGGVGNWWDKGKWDAQLTDELFALAVIVAGDLGPAQAKALGFEPGDYNAARTYAFLLAVAKSRAEMINDSTFKRLMEAVADETDEGATPDSVFDDAVSQRSGAGAAAVLATVGSFARVEAGQQLLGTSAMKTWVATSGNPRTSHALMDGESVPIKELFSNGMNWPGDPAGGADEVAGCNCTVIVTSD